MKSEESNIHQTVRVIYSLFALRNKPGFVRIAKWKSLDLGGEIGKGWRIR